MGNWFTLLSPNLMWSSHALAVSVQTESISFNRFLSFGFCCMIAIKVDIVYNQIVRGRIVKTEKADRNV